jgi:hypothetical protein
VGTDCKVDMHIIDIRNKLGPTLTHERNAFFECSSSRNISLRNGVPFNLNATIINTMA